MTSNPRYVVRVLRIPPSYTKDTFVEELTKQHVLYKNVWIALTDAGDCAGFGFIEFSCKDEMSMFIARYPLTQHNDVVWLSKDDKI